MRSSSCVPRRNVCSRVYVIVSWSCVLLDRIVPARASSSINSSVAQSSDQRQRRRRHRVAAAQRVRQASRSEVLFKHAPRASGYGADQFDAMAARLSSSTPRAWARWINRNRSTRRSSRWRCCCRRCSCSTQRAPSPRPYCRSSSSWSSARNTFERPRSVSRAAVLRVPPMHRDSRISLITFPTLCGYVG